MITLSGALTGALLIGVGSRVAMLLLRLTSPDHVRGVTSDDGFTIGEVTLGGTYNLLVLGAAFGIIGACAYRMVAPWLIGPLWFRRMTTGLASGAVVGSMLVHADGIDFTVLQPTWFAIGLFVALPAIFGVFIGVVVDAVGRPDSWTNRGRRKLVAAQSSQSSASRPPFRWWPSPLSYSVSGSSSAEPHLCSGSAPRGCTRSLFAPCGCSWQYSASSPSSTTPGP